MPGRDYAHAFALLDQSLQGSSYLKSNAATVPQLSYESDDDGSSDRPSPSLPYTPKTNGHAFSVNPFVNGQDPTLPPTPPATALRDLEATPPWKNSSNLTHLVHESGLTTPTNPRSLPTPENTPPQIRNHLSPNSSSQFQASSPYTESFQTACEDQTSPSADEALQFSLYNSGPQTDHSGHVTSSSRAAKLRGLGMDVLGYNSEHTPVLRHRADFSELDGTFNRESTTRDISGEWDHKKMNNITLRKADGKENVPLLMNGLSLHNDDIVGVHTPNSPDQQRLTRSDLSPVSDDSPFMGSLYDSEVKRLSGTSGSSTVVEAVVIDHTPPPRKRNLRHVGKAESLREGASPQLDRNSGPFEGSPASKPSLAHPRSLRRRNDTIPARPVTAPEEQNGDGVFNLFDDPRRVVSDPPKLFSISIEDMTPPPPSASPASFVTDEFHDPASNSVDEGVSAPIRNRRIDPNIGTSSPPNMPGAFSNRTVSEKSTSDAESARRESFGPSLRWSQYSAQQNRGASPRSIKSEETENFEINEAAAVQFSSHTNSSLLFIDHTNSSDAISGQRLAESSMATSETDVFLPVNLDAVTPTRKQFQFHAVDSPLRNPRAAPDPPTVTVIPPTPARELDELEDQNAMTPTRQTSLIERARRYSESLTGSFRRAHPTVGRRRSRSAGRTEQDERLHPDWQPKSYWGDIPSNENGRLGHPADDYYMAGGSGESESTEKWRRMGSLRGFLIGNSLGLQRGPTNKRRHVVNLPSNKIRKMNQNTRSKPSQPITVRASVKRSNSGKRIRRRSGTPSTFLGLRERMAELRWRREQILRDQHKANLKRYFGWPNESHAVVDERFHKV